MSIGMRLATDFDGVFTDPREEAGAFGQRQVEILRDALGGAIEEARGRVDAARREVEREPESFGWTHLGQISAYSDEDPYIFHEAVAERVHVAAAGGLARLGIESADAFATQAFHEGTEAWRRANPSHVQPEAVEALLGLLEGGLEVAIISNSPLLRVASILGLAELPQRLRIRGSARKFVLTPDRLDGLPEKAAFGGREVRVQRGLYLDVLEDEKPDLVIGDVLSLDLALPAVLRETRDWAKNLRIILRRAPYTPAWVLEACREWDIQVVEAFEDVLGLLT